MERGQKEIGRISLKEGEDLVFNLVDNEKLDLRVWMDTKAYKGPTKRGLRFYLFDGNWEEFMGLVQKINKIYEEIS